MNASLGLGVGLELAAPLWLLLLPLALLPLWPGLGGRPVEGGQTWLRHPDAAGLGSAARQRGAGAVPWLRVLALALLLLALAQPRSPGEFIPEPVAGRDLVLVVDTSGSMLVRDYRAEGRPVSRIEVLQGVVTRFVRAREGDRFALIPMAEEAATLVPLTGDRELVASQLARLRAGMLGDDTAIGDGIALALRQLQASGAERRPALILFSDGESNAGLLRPSEALALARAAGVALYTVEITGGQALAPVEGEPSLADMAETTGGRHFHVTRSADLEAVIATIDRLEAAEAAPPGGERLWRPWYPLPLGGALALLAVAGLLALRRGP
ncbi:VWA domain-containing protein [Thioalkalivibrio sulfidiphilus]|uniref:von Willebrand factor type A n=1 Tax=Thioalkalivibrio sulfidiphilus (strain HL-EbGR7) TaxID=396588 RepID=B8GT95_THISH|nr:VWA domain-containing protein [Thioalkalivibrio sulfidiphilus]ACL71155.1 von Willebrand factor type A [Thioalkalivibrio sulfidiphilus HL-EbGr7]